MTRLEEAGYVKIDKTFVYGSWPFPDTNSPRLDAPPSNNTANSWPASSLPNHEQPSVAHPDTRVGAALESVSVVANTT